MHIHTIQLNIEKVVGGTAHMDAAEFGAYMALLIVAYQTKNRLPDDDARLARMAKCTPKVWSRVRPVVALKFTILDGFWSHSVVRQQLETYERLSTKNKTNSLKRFDTTDPVDDPKSENGSSNTSNNNQIKDKPPTPLPDWLPAEPWKKYCKHRGSKFTQNAKDLAIKKLENWHTQGHDITEILENSIMNGWKGLFEPKERKNETNSGTYGQRDRSSQAKNVVARAIGETIFADEGRPAGEKTDR